MMISTATTQYIARKIEAGRAAEAAAQARLEEQIRLDDARQSWTAQDLLALVDVALEAHDHSLANELAWDVVARDSRYVMLSGWNWSRPVALRPSDVPAHVRWITGCTCDGGTCSHCTCCELWNGEHSCMYEPVELRDDGFRDAVWCDTCCRWQDVRTAIVDGEYVTTVSCDCEKVAA